MCYSTVTIITFWRMAVENFCLIFKVLWMVLEFSFFSDWCPVFRGTVFLLLDCRLFAFTLYCFDVRVQEWEWDLNLGMEMERNRELTVAAHHRICRGTAPRSPVLTRVGIILRSANRHLLAVPRFRLNTYGRGVLSCWPDGLELTPGILFGDPASNTDCFRRLLKTYLFARY